MPQQQDAEQTTSARKLKKRELDRKAQRVARERTKNRIANLEGLVKRLKADNPNNEVSDLTTALTSVTEERDALAAALRSVEHMVQTQLRALSSPSSCVPPSLPLDGVSMQAEFTLDAPPDFPLSQTHSHACGQEWEAQNAFDGGTSADVIVPTPEWPCYCTDIDLDQQAKNTWRAVNTALVKSTRLSPSQLAIEDFTGQDTPVRVVLDGWDRVEMDGKMSQSWRKLRVIDETCFYSCGNVERLAILTTMHSLIIYHGDPSRERENKLPSWLWTR